MSKPGKKDSGRRSGKISSAGGSQKAASRSTVSGRLSSELQAEQYSQSSLNQAGLNADLPVLELADTKLEAPVRTKSRSTVSAKSRQKTKLDAAASDDDDPELQALLIQVDKMLTEMTQSRWMATNWPHTD